MGLIWLCIKIVFWATVMCALLFTLMTHLLLWIELRLNALHEGEKLAVSLPTLFKSMGIEFCCAVCKAFLYPFYTWTPSQTTSYEKGGPLPVLLVHGYFNNQTDWIWFAHQLQKKEGIGPLFSLNLSPFTGSIPEFALLIKAKVEEILSLTGAAKVILVGHSLGGLVCSYYAENHAKPNSIHKIITLGSGFKGTLLTALGYGKSMTEMMPESDFLEELRKKIQKSSVPYFSIASKIDNIVIPWHSALLDDAAENNKLVLEDHGHLRLLISQPVIDQVFKWILS